MASAGAAQIEADAGEKLKIIVKGKPIADYATIQGILIGQLNHRKRWRRLLFFLATNRARCQYNRTK